MVIFHTLFSKKQNIRSYKAWKYQCHSFETVACATLSVPEQKCVFLKSLSIIKIAFIFIKKRDKLKISVAKFNIIVLDNEFIGKINLDAVT